jgi:N-acetylglucosaminyldiphosphoundecaprenol N-acetyl-beta-D-mannosaminyltransferase
MDIQRENILGVAVSAINMDQAIHQLRVWIQDEVNTYVCVTPAHAIMECANDSSLMSIYNESGLTTPDGMAIVWLLKSAGHSHVTRVYGPDLLLTACKELSIDGARHFFFGGADHVVNQLAERLQTENPQMKVAGLYSPPFRALSDEEDEKIIEIINSSQADIVWVGLGSPRQEKWMATHYNRINAVLIGVGAAFDFLSGEKKQAPMWIQKSGLEWLFRLLTEPKRLWRRYIQYPRFVWLVLLQKMGLKKY